MSKKQVVNVEFEAVSFSLKIKKEEDDSITIKIPSILKSQLERLPKGKEFSISLSSILKGAGSFLENFK